ncbi:MAG: hypothetical protein H0W50_11655 [Parachlamydiaceae bacterium]|nr:hypothetical protein [Parachlamydiaceae bacterium]
MRHQNMTFSIPEDLKTILKSYVRKRGLSQFISNAIFKALKEQEIKQEQDLDAAYEASNQDTDRLEILKVWNALDDTSDLIDDSEDWSWLKNFSKNQEKLRDD